MFRIWSIFAKQAPLLLNAYLKYFGINASEIGQSIMAKTFLRNRTYGTKSEIHKIFHVLHKTLFEDLYERLQNMYDILYNHGELLKKLSFCFILLLNFTKQIGSR